MAQCTNGTRAKAAAPAYFWFTWSAFIAWLALRFSRLGTIVWAFFGDSPFNVTEFCAAEPDIPSAPTTAQWIGFFTLDFAARVAVEQYLIASFKAYIWPTYCECVPSTGVGSTCGFGYASYPHTFANTSSLGTCRWYAQEFSVNHSTVVYGGRVNMDTAGQTFQIYLWDRTLAPNTPIGGQQFTSVVGDHFYYFDTPVNVGTGSTYSLGVQLVGTIHLDNSLTRTNNSIVNYGDVTVSTVCSQTTVPTTSDGRSFPLEPIVCDGGPPSGAPIAYTPPTPTDPTDIPDHPEFTCTTTADLCSRVNALQQAIATIGASVNWLQSAIAPTCWVPGTLHASLTGAGTIAVTDIVGAYVTMSIPTSFGRTSETPPRSIPKAGELQFAVDGVVADDHQLHYTSQQILGAPTASNSIVYNFKPGVTGSITPLQRCK